MVKLTIATGLLGLMMAGAAVAQTAPASSMDKATLSKSCSTQADAKGLHGKVRKHFRSQCTHGH